MTIYGPIEDWLHGTRGTGDANAATAVIEQQLRVSGATDVEASLMRERLHDAGDAIGPVNTGVAHSVGIFATDTELTVYPMVTSPHPVAHASDRFLIGPLVAEALATSLRVVVLALSAHRVRLIDASPLNPQLILVPGLPTNVEEAVPLDLTGDRDTLAHLRTSEDPKERLREYGRAVWRAVEAELRGREPLVIVAGAEPLASIFRSIPHTLRLADETIAGNHDETTVAELAALAWPIAAKQRELGTRAVLDRFAEMPARGRVLVELEPVIEACRVGAADTLLVDVNRRALVPSQAFSVATTLDQVDEAVRAALSTDATIVPVQEADLPTVDPVAAILRYPMASRQSSRSGVV